MERQRVSSSNIESVGYDSTSGILEVEFKSGSIYQYFDVPLSIYEGLMSASSVGRYFMSKVKNLYSWEQI